jgi:hypothetical protein
VFEVINYDSHVGRGGSVVVVVVVAAAAAAAVVVVAVVVTSERTPHFTIKVKLSYYRYTGGRDSSYSFLTSALDGSEWSASRLGRTLPPWERNPGTHWIEGWVGRGAGLDTETRAEVPLLL